MHPLDRKLFRDLFAMRGQVVAICLVIASGIATFVMSLSTLDSLRRTQASYYERSRFAEVFSRFKRAPRSLVEPMAAIPGVVAVDPRVVVDVSNSPSFEPAAVMHFFQTSTRQLLNEATAAGVRHVVALSVVGTDRLRDSGYFLAKLAQEQLIRGGALPHTIVRATQFHEFLGAIADAATRDGRVHAPSAGIQPIAASDVAAAVALAATAEPLNGLTEIAGPQAWPMDELLRDLLRQRGDGREVVTDEGAGYFGAPLQADSLLPGPGAWLAPTTLQAWLAARATASA